MACEVIALKEGKSCQGKCDIEPAFSTMLIIRPHKKEALSINGGRFAFSFVRFLILHHRPELTMYEGFTRKHVCPLVAAFAQ